MFELYTCITLKKILDQDLNLSTIKTTPGMITTKNNPEPYLAIPIFLLFEKNKKKLWWKFFLNFDLRKSFSWQRTYDLNTFKKYASQTFSTFSTTIFRPCHHLVEQDLLLCHHLFPTNKKNKVSVLNWTVILVFCCQARPFIVHLSTQNQEYLWENTKWHGQKKKLSPSAA